MESLDTVLTRGVEPPVTGSARGGSRTWGRPVERVARLVVLAAALVPIGVYLWVALHQIGYPYELEWLEGGSVEVAARVFHGHNIYVAPSLHYVPYPYTPLYYWVTGLLAHVTGIGFFPLRLVSFLSSLGCFGLLFKMVQTETGDAVAGTVAAGLFAATYQVSESWLDIGRVDSLSLLLLLAAVAVGRRAERFPAAVLVGLLIFASFFTKQSALLAALPLVVLLIVVRRRTGLVVLATLATTVVGSTLLMNAVTHDWYGYYAISELLHQGVAQGALSKFVRVDMLAKFGWAIALGVAGLATGLWRRPTRTAWSYWVAAAVGFVGSSLVSRLHSGGAPNVLIPAYAAIALLAALGYDALRRSDLGPPTAVGVAVVFVVVVQLALRMGHPAHLIPSAADAEAGRRFVAQVAATPGPVLVYDHPWYETMAGKPSFAQGEAVHDVLRAGPSLARTDLLVSIKDVMANPRLITVYLDDTAEEPNLGLNSPSSGFVAHGRVFSCYQCFFPATDLASRPAFRFIRVGSSAPAR